MNFVKINPTLAFLVESVVVKRNKKKEKKSSLQGINHQKVAACTHHYLLKS